ncbi:MAG: uroporphyrinogen decarboxylase [Opitutales bacterium]|nr:uroporphyrinogen decarboxylase [Opitutales bacterium]
MNSRERFFKALHGEAVYPVPAWLMRQAGRYLPEYRALKEKHGFLKMVQTPDLATEVTLQPIRRFDFDAAILFSDILVIPEAMGQPYHFRDQGGIGMDFAVRSAEQIRALTPEKVPEHLAYVPAALKLLRKELGERKALLGFTGSPFTLASYMIEGGSSADYLTTKRLFWENRPLYEELLEKITQAVIQYASMQAEAGADAFQIFDSWGGVLPGNDYEEASLKWIRRIVAHLKGKIPVILFAKGLSPQAEALAQCGVKALSLDYTAPLRTLAPKLAGKVAIQGNLDPLILETSPELTAIATRRILDELEDYPGHIFNLGHGIRPGAKIENVEALLATIREGSGKK